MNPIDEERDATATTELGSTGLLPRGWAKTLLLLVVAILALGYLIGLRAHGPGFRPPPPVRIHVVPPPESIPD